MYYDDSRTENRVIFAVQVKYDIYMTIIISALIAR